MTQNKLTISIVGTGAIGGFYGIMLSKIGHDVHFLLHSDYDCVKENGLTLRSAIHGEIKLDKINVYKDAAQMPISDVVIVALKTMQNKVVLPKILPNLADEKTNIILIQNGLGMEEELANWFPNFQIAGATALIGSKKEKKGVIVHESFGNIDFGSYNIQNFIFLDALVSDLKSINIPATIQNLKMLRWKKLVWNMTFNGLCVVRDANTDVLLRDDLPMVKKMMQEVIDAAKTDGIEIADTFIDGLLSFTKKMGSYAPSMRFDYLNQQPLEVEYLYKNPIDTARKNGFKMCESEIIYQKLLLIKT